MVNDPLVLEPRLWFGVLCHAFGTDPAGRITLQGVFNQIQFFTPDEATGMPPHALLSGILAVGFSDGLGHFDWEVDLMDLDDNVLWTRPGGQWSFDMGPGEMNSAILTLEVRHWLTQPGKFHFRLHRPGGLGDEHRIPFEVAERIGPSQVEGETQPEEPRQ